MLQMIAQIKDNSLPWLPFILTAASNGREEGGLVVDWHKLLEAFIIGGVIMFGTVQVLETKLEDLTKAVDNNYHAINAINSDLQSHKETAYKREMDIQRQRIEVLKQQVVKERREK